MDDMRYIKVKKKGSYIKEGLKKKKGEYDSEAVMHKDHLNIYKRLIPIEPDSENKSYEKGCDATSKRYSYGYEYENDGHELTADQCQVVENYNNTSWKYIRAMENAQLSQQLYNLLDDKAEYEFYVNDLIEMGLGSEDMD